ncbi:UNVERIFIED_CONTAM: hypothetical protein GTU68_007193 [Idotea baltica]|nr:hypothetical protein [Idotea baltica]
MHANGVSHAVAPNDLEAIHTMLQWLSYVPKRKECPGPVMAPMDPIDRPVGFVPGRTPYDPRWLIMGRENPGNPGDWESGFFDKGSFREILAPWAQTVITGRARLGGIPVGVICVETRTVELHLPADPANPDSEAKTVSQAGLVWFPDSAYKTSQAIKDFNHEELPLIIFANWRGFSGGMKDMYEQVVKFGAYIVDALREYNQPILVYLPPYSELRGGAWVVIDSTINERHMEMYADPLSRGGVLEPEGTVEIKFKDKDLIKTMIRLDKPLQEMMQKLQKEDLPTDETRTLKKQILERQDNLKPLYHQVAVMFADLHDTPERMLEKGVIQGIVPWNQSRPRLYWRLRRVLAEERVKKIIRKHQPGLSDGQIDAMLRRWFFEERGSVESYLWDSDQSVAEWVEQQMEGGGSSEEGPSPTSREGATSHLLESLQMLKKDSALNTVKQLTKEYPEISMDVVVHLVQRMDASQRADTFRTLTTLDSLVLPADRPADSGLHTPEGSDNTH